MAQHTFLVEIGTAELPPKALRSLAEAFADNFKAELTKADLAFGDVEWFAFTAPSGAEGKRAGWRTAEQERREARPGRGAGVRCRRQADQGCRRLGPWQRHHR